MIEIKITRWPDGKHTITWHDPNDPVVFLHWYQTSKTWAIRSPWGERVVTPKEAIGDIYSMNGPTRRIFIGIDKGAKTA